jgi:hypothetical protein
MKYFALIALLATTACGTTTTIWENEHEQYGSQDAGGFDSGPVAGHTDPVGVVGVDSGADGDDAASDDAGSGDDDGGFDGDVSKGHDDHGDDHGKGHDSDDDGHGKGRDGDDD